MKFSNVESESCSISMRIGLVNYAMLTIVVSYCRLLTYVHEIGMTGGSLGIVRRGSFSHFPSSFSVVSCWSVLSKKTDYSCAMPVDSMLTSFGFMGMSSLVFRTVFSVVSISN